jgi:alpha-glucosidase
VPLPWSGAASPFGFSPEGADATPWLRQPAGWAARTVEAQSAGPGSMLGLYRAMLGLRRREPGLATGEFAWLPSAPGVLAFTRGAGIACVANLSAGPADLPPDCGVLLASAPLVDGRASPDTTVWLRTAPAGPVLAGATSPLGVTGGGAL